jgi:hypothetical protein
MPELIEVESRHLVKCHLVEEKYGAYEKEKN